MKGTLIRVLVCGGLATAAVAQERMLVNESGQYGGYFLESTIGDGVDCGALGVDGENGVASQRRGDGLESWVIVPCEVDGKAQRITWYAIDFNDADFQGAADYAAWTADTVENGCANDSSTCAGQMGAAATREALLDDNGNQVTLFGFNAWVYSVEVDEDLTCAGYIGVRAVVARQTAGQSFILTRDCDGDDQIWFQSNFFGIDCAVPGDTFFPFYCVAIEVTSDFAETGACCLDDGSCADTTEDECDGTFFEGEECDTFECPPVAGQCLYTVTKVELKKMKSVLCLKVCDDCPFNVGDIICGIECDEADDCKDELKGKLACPGGGRCTVEAKLLEDNKGCADCPAGGINACPNF